VVEGNSIGITTGEDGSDEAAGNAVAGVLLSEGASENVIGGVSDGSANFVGANTFGVLINFAAHDNIVQNNFIGTNHAGEFQEAFGNTSLGVAIANAHRNTIGGDAEGAGNTIAFTTMDPQEDPDNPASGDGVSISEASSTHNRVLNNVIFSNARNGIAISAGASNNSVGAAGAGNVIGQNEASGVVIFGEGTSFNTVEGNSIGIVAREDGSDEAAGNAVAGVQLSEGASENVIGGLSDGSANFVAANAIGVLINFAAHDNKVQSNFIGTNHAGEFQDGFGNTESGVVVTDAARNTIGGETDAAGNLIAFNGMHGVRLAGAGARENRVRKNIITAHTVNGVDISE
jgi:hypothetical protein